jgi:hypothetical protein
MTAVMRAAGLSRARVLRVGVVRASRLYEERVLDSGMLTVGPSERADVVLPAGAPSRLHRLLERRGDSWRLVPGAGMRARVACAGEVLELTEQSPPLELDRDARGRILIGSTTLLFQLVPAPPERPRPQLPLSVMHRERDDWGTMIIAALSFLLHFGLMGVLFSDWVDPVVDDGVQVTGLIESMRTLPAPPVETPEQSAAAATQAKSPASPPRSARRGARSRRAGAPAHTGAASAARLQHQLDAIEMKTLGALASNRPATADVLGGHEVPTAALDRAAKSSAGVGSGDPFHVEASGVPLRPGADEGLAGIGTRTGAEDTSTGNVQHVAGPVTKTAVASRTTVGTVDNAQRVVLGMRPAFHACYRREIESNPDAQGKVRLTLQIGAGGEVDKVSATHSGNLSPTLVGCMVQRARAAEFHPPAEGSAVVAVPVTLVLNR